MISYQVFLAKHKGNPKFIYDLLLLVTMSLKNKKVVRTVQVIFGLMNILFAANGFFQFMPAPQFNEAGSAFLGALANTGYMIVVISLLHLVVGLLFLINRFSPLAAVLLAPFSFNILLFHLFLDFQGWYLAAIVIILNVYMLWVHKEAYKPMLK